MPRKTPRKTHRKQKRRKTQNQRRKQRRTNRSRKTRRGGTSALRRIGDFIVGPPMPSFALSDEMRINKSINGLRKDVTARSLNDRSRFILDHTIDILIDERKDSNIDPALIQKLGIEDIGGIVANNKQSVLYNVCALGSNSLVDKLIKDNPTSINKEFRQNGKEYTPLFIAVWNGHKKVVETLLEQAEVVKYLLDKSKHCNFNYLITLANRKIKETEEETKSIKEVNETRKRLFEIEARNSQPQSLKKQDIDKIEQKIAKNQKRIKVYKEIIVMINEKIHSSET